MTTQQPQNSAPTPNTFRLAVCEAPPELVPGTSIWNEFAAAVAEAAPDVLLLNELPFGPWLADTPTVNPIQLKESLKIHDEAMAQIRSLNVPIVLGTRPAAQGDGFTNEAFIWSPPDGYQPVHTKQYFPQEEGYYEASWYQRGESHFRISETGGLKAAFLICTEVMFNEWARYYGRNGAHLIAVPRATPAPSTRRWRVAMQMTAIVSGCYSATSNRSGISSRGQEFGAHGWIVDPYGDIIAETSKATPVVVATIYLSAVGKAQKEYPCYVEELG